MRLFSLLSVICTLLALIATSLPADAHHRTASGQLRPHSRSDGATGPVYWNGRIWPEGTYIVPEQNKGSSGTGKPGTPSSHPNPPSQNNNCTGIC